MARSKAPTIRAPTAGRPGYSIRLLAVLCAAGHDVQVMGEPYASAMGHAGAVVLHPDGTLEGGHDPRADGGAAGV